MIGYGWVWSALVHYNLQQKWYRFDQLWSTTTCNKSDQVWSALVHYNLQQKWLGLIGFDPLQPETKVIAFGWHLPCAVVVEFMLILSALSSFTVSVKSEIRKYFLYFGPTSTHWRKVIRFGLLWSATTCNNKSDRVCLALTMCSCSRLLAHLDTPIFFHSISWVFCTSTWLCWCLLFLLFWFTCIICRVWK